MPSIIGLIPARSGSKRIPEKNIRRLGDHPLLAYTIASAIGSGVFDCVLVSTDSEHYADIARHYGAEAPFLRPADFSADLSPDIEWVEYTLTRLAEEGRRFDCFSILRPTSPFRLPDTIRRAWRIFLSQKGVDSLRAVEKCKQHPGKMWVIRQNRMMPLLPLGPEDQPWHSSPYQSLPEVYVQNASLEIAWSRVVFEDRTIAGNVIVPFHTQGFEGFDLNDHYDWSYALQLLSSQKAQLPEVEQTPYGKEGETY
ncbi:MAG: acylneuraminate cytidylyltransferase family protein [Deltaproteobacteria bacterium]|nr:acylneuraminate cytidylyltransferase family protein [Deltaproteobacteria bacterium]